MQKLLGHAQQDIHNREKVILNAQFWIQYTFDFTRFCLIFQSSTTFEISKCGNFGKYFQFGPILKQMNQTIVPQLLNLDQKADLHF